MTVAFSEESIARITHELPPNYNSESSAKLPFVRVSPESLMINFGYGEWMDVRYNDDRDVFCCTIQVERRPRFDLDFADEKAAVEYFIKNLRHFIC